jgi:large subunit ribosomal protein L32e
MAKKDIIKEFQNLNGVGAKKAEQLYDSGITSMDKLKKTSIKDIIKIDGFSDTLAEDIKKQVGSEETKETKEKEEEPKKVETKKPEKKKEKTKVETKEKPEEKKPEPEEVEAVEEEEQEYEVKKKPKLTEDVKKLLNLRTKIKDKTPDFNRQESFRYKRLKKGWRKPRGLHSKMRMNFGYRPDMARVGFRGPKKVRGLHPSGFEEVMVYNLSDVEKIDPDTQAARISGNVGTWKRSKIIKKAEDLKIRILNK